MQNRLRSTSVSTEPCLLAGRFMQKARLDSIQHNVGALAARKQGAAPLNCARHRRLVACYWRLVLHTTKGFETRLCQTLQRR